MKILAVYKDVNSLNAALSKIGEVFKKEGLVIANLQSIQIYSIPVMDKDCAKEVAVKFAEFNCDEDLLIICNESLYKDLYSKGFISEASFLGSGGWTISTYFLKVCPIFNYVSEGKVITSGV